MGRRGPAPMPTALAALRGTEGKRDRRRTPKGPEPVPKGALRTIPPHIAANADAKACWQSSRKHLQAMKVVTAADVLALEGLCVSYARALAADRDIEKHGTLVLGAQGQLMNNPAIRIATVAWAEVRRFSQEFGMTPASRTRVRAQESEKKPAKDSPDDFIFKPAGKVVGAIRRHA